MGERGFVGLGDWRGEREREVRGERGERGDWGGERGERES